MKWLKNSVLGIIIVSIIASFIYDGIKKFPFGFAILKVLNWIKAAVVNIFTFQIPVWVLIGLFLLFLLYIVLFAKKPKHFTYTKAIFRRWIWKWKYYFNGNSWKITDLKAFCPNCDVVLIDNSSSRTRNKYCPKCRNDYSSDRDMYEYNVDTEILIYDSIEKGQYPKAK